LPLPRARDVVLEPEPFTWLHRGFVSDSRPDSRVLHRNERAKIMALAGALERRTKPAAKRNGVLGYVGLTVLRLDVRLSERQDGAVLPLLSDVAGPDRLRQLMCASAQIAPRDYPSPVIEYIQFGIVARGYGHNDGEPLRVIEEPHSKRSPAHRTMRLAARNGRLDGKAYVGSHGFLPGREFQCHVADPTRAPGDSSRPG
jgi:hypothetical protein